MSVDLYKVQTVKKTLSAALEAVGRVLIDSHDYPEDLSVVEMSNRIVKALGWETLP